MSLTARELAARVARLAASQLARGHRRHKEIAMSRLIDDRYLGDGVYVSFDGYQFWLDTRAQSPMNRIALGSDVIEQFEEYCRDVQTALEKVQKP